jgi:signal transduction histidine kinase
MRRRLRPSSVLLIAALVATAAYAPAFAHHGLGFAVGAAAGHVLPAALLGWGVWRLATRERPPRPWGRAAAEHALGAVLYSGLWTAAVYALGRLAHPGGIDWGDVAVWQFLSGVPVYGMIAGVAHASRATARLRERDLAAARAELQALRAQLDPHFLFNTLHSVTALVREDPRGAEEALERFGGLMRYVLDAGRADEVALADELAFVRDYLALEGLRLGERLRVEEAVDAEALECAVPPLLLQPLVENAVRHGIAPRRAGGTVRLAARCTGARILLEVADDGAGADPAALPEADGLGLAAVRRQLEARFPGAGRMDVETRPGGGFVVRLAVPARSARATGGAGRPPAGEAAALAW